MFTNNFLNVSECSERKNIFWKRPKRARCCKIFIKVMKLALAKKFIRSYRFQYRHAQRLIIITIKYATLIGVDSLNLNTDNSTSVRNCMRFAVSLINKLWNRLHIFFSFFEKSRRVFEKRCKNGHFKPHFGTQHLHKDFDDTTITSDSKCNSLSDKSRKLLVLKVN